MVFEEPFFLELRRAFHAHDARLRVHLHQPLRLDAAHVAGDELEGGVLESCAGVIVDRHPAGKAGLLVVGVNDGDVVGGPVHAVGEIRDLGGRRARLRDVEGPNQRRARDEIRGKVGEGHLAALTENDPVAHAVYGAAVRGQESRFDRARREVVRLLDDLDVASDVLFHQLFGRDQVVLVVLLEHGGAVLRRGAARGRCAG